MTRRKDNQMTHEMIDTKRMREFANRLNDAKLLFGSTHFEGCEYFHMPCAILKLCDELDAANALLEEQKAERMERE